MEIENQKFEIEKSEVAAINILKIIIVSLFLGVAVFASQNKISWKEAFIKEQPEILQDTERIETVSLADTIMLHQNERNIFLDVRMKRYYDYAHIPGAVNIPSDKLETIPEEKLKKLKSAPNVVLYCVSTSCGISYRAARILMKKGLHNLKVYSGGWGEWKSCQLPIIGIINKTHNEKQ